MVEPYNMCFSVTFIPWGLFTSSHGLYICIKPWNIYFFFPLQSHELTETDWSLVKDNDVDTYAEIVTDRILYLVNKHIPNKLVHIRKSYPSWLTSNIKRLMRKRKRIYDKY